MIKTSKNSLLRRAEEQFISGEYSKSLQSYGLLLKDNPDLGEARVGVYLSDLGMESEDDAQALFDYYQVIKSEQDDAEEIISNIITTLDNSKNSLQELLVDPFIEQVEYEDGIRYDDFLKFIEDRGDFKQAFEDIMFSTKVVITSKEEFIGFIKNLAQEGYTDVALAYLDGAVNTFDGDQKLFKLYELFDKEVK